jgi:hypothetical protein
MCAQRKNSVKFQFVFFRFIFLFWAVPFLETAFFRQALGVISIFY